MTKKIKLQKGQLVQHFGDAKRKGIFIKKQRHPEWVSGTVSYKTFAVLVYLNGVNKDYVPIDHIKPVNKKKLWYIKKRVRSDGFDFYFLTSPDGKKSIVSAGCRAFTSLAKARKHWRNRRRDWLIASGDVKENDKLNKWSLKHIDELEKEAKRRRARAHRRKK